MPLVIEFSIIVAVYNGEKYLPRLLSSVTEQQFKNFELIIVDGGSIDQTVQIIRNYEKHIAYWISEQDSGIYEAWNKGIRMATGKWIMFLGADDILLPDTLKKYYDFIQLRKDKNELEYISSRAQMIDSSGKDIWVNGWIWQWPKFLRKMTVAHPGSLHSIKLFNKYGLYDSHYKITADYELLLRPRKHLKAAFLNDITVKMTEGGASDSIAAIKEHYRAATTTGGASRASAFLNGLYVCLKSGINKKARTFGFNTNIKRK